MATSSRVCRASTGAGGGVELVVRHHRRHIGSVRRIRTGRRSGLLGSIALFVALPGVGRLFAGRHARQSRIPARWLAVELLGDRAHRGLLFGRERLDVPVEFVGEAQPFTVRSVLGGRHPGRVQYHRYALAIGRWTASRSGRRTTSAGVEDLDPEAVVVQHW